MQTSFMIQNFDQNLLFTFHKIKHDTVAVWSKAFVSGRSIAGTAGWNHAGGIDVCLLCLLCVVRVEASATGQSPVQGNSTEHVCPVCDKVQQ
jgi:hypothetical protein